MALMSVKDLHECRALNEYLNPNVLASYNVVSALSRAFVECLLECVEGRCESDILENYISLFNRVATERLEEAYSCGRVKGLLEESRRRVMEVYSFAREVFGSAFMLQGVLQSRLLVHTRSPTLPLDVSLAWDPILNLPYIPASTVKGVVRAYLTNNIIGGLNVGELLGEGGEEGHVSYVIFFDSYPVDCRGTLVEPDIITPHYREVEGLIDETSVKPTPIVFPTIAPGTTIYFPVAINMKLIKKLPSGNKVKKLEDVNTINDLVDKIMRALESGIGAKTSLGYGYVRMSRRS